MTRKMLPERNGIGCRFLVAERGSYKRRSESLQEGVVVPCSYLKSEHQRGIVCSGLVLYARSGVQVVH